jgi:hypothetical protein
MSSPSLLQIERHNSILALDAVQLTLLQGRGTPLYSVAADGDTQPLARRTCAISLCTCVALYSASRGGSTAALDGSESAMANDSVKFNEVIVDASAISDWPTFHSVFSKAFGFPDFYGHNMDAWIDCMSYLDEPESGMSAVHTPPNGIVLLKLLNAKEFSKRCPEQFSALNECSAFVNWRRRERGGAPVLALSYYE